MALTQKEISQLYVALLNRAADADGVAHWQAQDVTLAESAQQMIDSQEGTGFYPADNLEFVKQIYANTVGLEGQAEEDIQYWADLLDGDMTRGELVAHMVASIMDPQYEGTDFQNSFINRVAVSEYVSGLELPEMSDEELVAATTFDEDGLGEVRTEADADAARAAADALVGDAVEPEPEPEPEPEGPVVEHYLTVGQDVSARDFEVSATEKNVFIADIAPNALGQEANTLNSGDRLVGGSSNEDTLEAKLMHSYSLGSLPKESAPITDSIEIVKVDAQLNGLVHGLVDSLAPFIPVELDFAALNAKNMNGVTEFTSFESDASLLITNILGNQKGKYSVHDDMTIGMKYTGNSDTLWTESNMTALFDQDYLSRETEEINGRVLIINNAENIANGENPVEGFDSFTFTLNGAGISITVDLTGSTSYADVVNKINAKIAEEGLEGQVVARALPEQPTFYSESGVLAGYYNPILIENYGPETVTISEIKKGDDYVDADLNSGSRPVDAVSTLEPVTVNVELEKVGRAGEGGGLQIGSMNKGSAIEGLIDGEFNNNVFGGVVSTTDTVDGFDQFDVTVFGDTTKNSSLSYLHSTNNSLRTVNIVSEAGGNADLTIGNGNSLGAKWGSWGDGGWGYVWSNATAFKDVQIMDASGFNGRLDLKAGLTDEIVEKYLANTEVTLNGLNNVAESAHFQYDGGSNDDVLNIAIDGESLDENFENDGGTIGHNVFSMLVNGGAGDDHITVNVEDGNYNSHLGATNITINGGVGNDLIDISQDTAYNSDSYDWTFTIAFDGKHFGHDTIVGFDIAAVELTNEHQYFDFTNWIAHEGETIRVKLEGDFYDIKVTDTMVDSTGEMDENAIAQAVADVLNGTTGGVFNRVNKFEATDPSDLITGAVASGPVVEAEKLGENVGSFSVEVLPKGHEAGSADAITPIHSDTATTLSQGGIWGSVIAEEAFGGDVLDFSAYGAKGVIVVDKDGTSNMVANVEAGLVGNNTYVYLVQADHVVEGVGGVYNVYIANNTDDDHGDFNVATGATVIGSIDFGYDINDSAGAMIDASQLVF